MSEHDEGPGTPTWASDTATNDAVSVLDISTSPRANGPWKQGTTSWPDFLLTLGETADHKECGGYVFGRLKYNRRERNSVISRSAVTLDADYATPDLIDRVRALGYTAAWYTTWRHTPEAPRYRLIFPTARPLTPAEYWTTAGALMDRLGRELMDPTTDQPERFMWRPSSQDRASYDHGSMNGELLPALVSAAHEQPAPERKQPIDIPALVRNGIPVGEQDDTLVRVTYALAAQGTDEDEARATWWEIVGASRQDGRPWSEADFDRHWRGAVGKVEQERAAAFGVYTEPGAVTPGGGWGPVDLSAYLDGTYEPLEAKLLRRNDGVALLYPGMTHSLHGESESGKSMVAQYEAVQQMQAGNAVLYADYEADAGSVIERMLLMGATREQIAALLTYVNPELDPGHNEVTRAAFEALLSRRFTLAVLDGVNEALTQSPARDRSTSGLGGNDDITAWQARLPRRIATRTGAAVVLIDHVAKGEAAGRFAIGGQAKMAALTGAAYVVRPSNPIGKGLTGTVELWVAKDRHGYVRGNANPDYKADRLQHVATAIVDGVNGLTIDLVAPPMRLTAIDQSRQMQDRVVEFLRDLPADHEGASVNMVKANVSGKDAQIAEALKALVDRGEVVARFRGVSKLHRLAANQP